MRLYVMWKYKCMYVCMYVLIGYRTKRNDRADLLFDKNENEIEGVGWITTNTHTHTHTHSILIHEE